MAIDRGCTTRSSALTRVSGQSFCCLGFFVGDCVRLTHLVSLSHICVKTHKFNLGIVTQDICNQTQASLGACVKNLNQKSGQKNALFFGWGELAASPRNMYKDTIKLRELLHGQSVLIDGLLGGIEDEWRIERKVLHSSNELKKLAACRMDKLRWWKGKYE
jgi:hypothetical protein